MEEKELISKTKKFIEKLNENAIVFNNLLYNDFLPEGIYDEYKELIKDFKDFYGDSSSEFLLWKTIRNNLRIDKDKTKKYYLWDIAVNEKEDLVSDFYPNIEKTKDGLVEIKYGSHINKNGFQYKNHYLIFERELSSNFHLMRWIIWNWKGESSFYVAIDKDLLGLPETLREMMLLSHWEGPKNIKKVIESFDKNSLIVKGPSESKIPLYDKVEFLFEKRGDEWHLEIEELLPRRGVSFEFETQFNGKSEKYFTRYVHSITNEDITKCFHLDGAIRVYDNLDNFRKRNFSDLRKEDWSKKSKRFKLFRFDSEKGVEDFQKMIGLFFLMNPYVKEFFEGESEELKRWEEQRTGFFNIEFRDMDL